MKATTKKYKKIHRTSTILSWLFCFGTTAFLILWLCFGREHGTPLRDLLGSYIYGFIMANIPLVVLALMIKDKVKPVCWMVNVIMSNVVFGGAAIYVIFALWLIDTYILTYVKDYYLSKYRINKEIDSRE